MLDLTTIGKGSVFPVTLQFGPEEEPRVIELKPAKVKLLNRIIEFYKTKDDQDNVSLDELEDICVRVLNSTTKGYVFNKDAVEEFTMDQMQALLTEYLNWVIKTKKRKN